MPTDRKKAWIIQRNALRREKKLRGRKRLGKDTTTSASTATLANTNSTTADEDVVMSTGSATPDTTDSTAPDQDSEPKTTFMDLPVEIRTEIFGYLLVEDDPIGLQIRGLGINREVCRRETPRNTAQRLKGLYYYDESTKSYVRKPLQHTSVLLVNRQIHAEAESVLYGDNILCFQRTTVLKDFLQTISPSRAQLLRQVRIDGYVMNNAKETFQLLAAAKGLRKLELSHELLCEALKNRHTGASKSLATFFPQIARDLAPLLHSLRTSWEQRGLGGKVEDVVALYAVHGGICQMMLFGQEKPEHYCGCLCVEMPSRDLEILTELREVMPKAKPATIARITKKRNAAKPQVGKEEGQH